MHRHVIAAQIFLALLDQSLGPRLDVSGLQIRRDVGAILRRNSVPDSREVGFAIGGARRRGREVWLTIRRARNAGRGIV